jgi:hypothetical protein
MAKPPETDAGTIQALMARLEKGRLPRALAIKARVDTGEKLSDNDMQFLHGVFEDASSVQALAARHPEYQTLVVQLISLYDHITRKAVENEQAKPSR